MEKELTTINVSLPLPMRSYLESRVKLDGYGSVSDLIRSLIREDQKRQAQESLEKRLLSVLDQGEATPLTSEDWSEIKNAVKARLSSRK
jgi:antitoxin ParD1/3/4